MNPEKNKALAIELLQAAAASRIEDILRLMTEDATWWISGSTEFSGTYPARELFAASAKLFTETDGPFTGGVGALTAEDDRVSVEAWGHVQFRDGRVYHNEVHLLLTFRDGKVASVKEYGDTDLLVRLFRSAGADRS